MFINATIGPYFFFSQLGIFFKGPIVEFINATTSPQFIYNNKIFLASKFIYLFFKKKSGSIVVF